MLSQIKQKFIGVHTLRTKFNDKSDDRIEIHDIKSGFETIRGAAEEGEKSGLTPEETAFYDALTKPRAIKVFYENDELIAIARELTDMLRKNRTIDWQRKETARAGMRRMVKRLLKKHHYPPEDTDDAVTTVICQCELWTDNQN